MNAQKLIAKVSYGLNAILIVVIVGLLIYQQRHIRQITDNERQVPSVAAISDSNIRAENDTQTNPVANGSMEQLAATVETLRYQLEAAEEELEMAQEALANELGRQAANMSVFIDREKEILENPILMNTMRKQAENRLSEEYGALFERLGLPDEKIEDLKTLMVDFLMQSQEVSLGQKDQSLPEEERNEILQLLEDQYAEFKKQARELLGAENYEAYDAYAKRISERHFVHGFNLSEDLGLSDEKEQELIDAMYEARKEVEAEYGIDMQDITQQYRLDHTEEIDLRLDIYNSYIESGRRVLSESQAAQFESIIELVTGYHLPFP